MKKTIQTFVLAGMLLGGITQGLAQKQQIKSTKKQTTEILINDHEHIIKQSFSDILKKYGPEKGLDTIRKHLIIEVNKERVKAGVSELKANTFLDSAAQGHANFFASNKKFYFDTEGKLIKNPHEGKPKALTQRTMAAGYGSPMVSENMSIGTHTILEAVTARCNEPAHRQIMLDTNIQEGGIGIALLMPEYENIHMTGCVIVMDYGKPDPKKRKRTIQSE